MMAFLEEAFELFGAGERSWNEQGGVGDSCSGAIVQAVEHVVDETDRRLRAISGYHRVLRGPVTSSFRYIDRLVESVPGVFSCCRSAFSEDPRVNAFFVNPHHLQEVFSRSEDVRRLFETNPAVGDCYALLCMHKQERRQLGMALIGDAVRKEVMQTAVSFSNHQVMSPGACEHDARRALKCCIFHSVLSYLRNRMLSAKTDAVDLQTRLSLLRGRRHRLSRNTDADSRRRLGELQEQIGMVERKLAQQAPYLTTIEEELRFIADVLENPAPVVSAREHVMRLNHMGVKLEDSTTEPSYELCVSEVLVAGQEPRIAALVRFPRQELLTEQDHLKKADLFLVN